MIYHFYHCYATGEWETPLKEHIDALNNYELINSLDGFYIGLIGDSIQRANVIQYLHSKNINFTICAEADGGWEQVTQNKLYEFSLEHDGDVLYAHTKGAFNTGDYSHVWRRGITHHNVEKWRRCLEMLPSHDAVGAHWVTSESGKSFFAGTFWWTTLDFVRKLGPPKMNDRYDAEVWIGSHEPIQIYDIIWEELPH